MGLPREEVVICVQETGNVAGASAGIALARAERLALLRRGARVLLLDAGAAYAMIAVPEIF